eukprot:scaffold44698_cov75-Phaeocystis_antarctica.AAC.1
MMSVHGRAAAHRVSELGSGGGGRGGVAGYSGHKRIEVPRAVADGEAGEMREATKASAMGSSAPNAATRCIRGCGAGGRRLEARGMQEVVRAREVLPWVHVWSVSMSVRLQRSARLQAACTR